MSKLAGTVSAWRQAGSYVCHEILHIILRFILYTVSLHEAGISVSHTVTGLALNIHNLADLKHGVLKAAVNMYPLLWDSSLFDRMRLQIQNWNKFTSSCFRCNWCVCVCVFFCGLKV